MTPPVRIEDRVSGDAEREAAPGSGTLPTPAAARSLASLVEAAGADVAVLALLEDGRLVACAEVGPCRTPSMRLARHPLVRLAGERALESGTAILEGEMENGEPARRGAPRRLRALLALRLEGLTGPLGVVVLCHRDPPRAAGRLLARLADPAREAARVLEHARLTAQLEAERHGYAESRRALERRIRKAEDRRRALLHILSDVNLFNHRLSDQRKAMIHILADYEKDRSRMARQTIHLDNSRRALINILKDSHQSNLRLADSRKAMIHIMGDLRETTKEIQHREHELRDKQEQLVQAGKLATLGELTTGVAHELNNPLNNIGLHVGNVIDLIELGRVDGKRILAELNKAMLQVRKATEIISHLRTFGRAAPVSREAVRMNAVVERALALLQEQLRLREIHVVLGLAAEDPEVMGNPIQLEQVVLNLLTNARDALARVTAKRLFVTSRVADGWVELAIEDTGSGIPPGLERRIFDPFFTTKDVGSGTGLGLSITYGIVREHGGTIEVASPPGRGARFTLRFPEATP